MKQQQSIGAVTDTVDHRSCAPLRVAQREISKPGKGNECAAEKVMPSFRCKWSRRLSLPHLSDTGLQSERPLSKVYLLA